MKTMFWLSFGKILLFDAAAFRTLYFEWLFETLCIFRKISNEFKKIEKLKLDF